MRLSEKQILFALTAVFSAGSLFGYGFGFLANLH